MFVTLTFKKLDHFFFQPRVIISLKPRTDLSQTTIENLEALDSHFVLVRNSPAVRIHDPVTGNRTQNF